MPSLARQIFKKKKSKDGRLLVKGFGVYARSSGQQLPDNWDDDDEDWVQPRHSSGGTATAVVIPPWDGTHSLDFRYEDNSMYIGQVI